jgi:holo-[acyl-carrier protein] synthase
MDRQCTGLKTSPEQATGPSRRGVEHGAEAEASVRVGVDLASIEAVRLSIERFGDRYTRRCFTDHEIATSSGGPEVMAASLAARFAAKEATVKALAAGREAFDWRSIEIRRRPDGGCAVALHGAPAELAARQGVSELSVALTHEGPLAAAVVIALCRPPERRTTHRPSSDANDTGCDQEKENDG